jgi:hypothetical protein
VKNQVILRERELEREREKERKLLLCLHLLFRCLVFILEEENLIENLKIKI